MMGKKEETPQEKIDKMVKKSFGEGDADKDWDKEIVVSNPAKEPDPVNDLPPVD
jgi:hypothetical protein